MPDGVTYNIRGLSAAQCELLNAVGAEHEAMSAVLTPEQIERLSLDALRLEDALGALGIDLEDPRAHFTVLAAMLLIGEEAQRDAEQGLDPTQTILYTIGKVAIRRPRKAFVFDQSTSEDPTA